MTSTSSSANEPEYVLGTNEAELHRLGFQHRLWFVPAHRLWERAGIEPGKHILDVGCGPGFASLDMAQIVTNTGRVVGVDESPPYVEFANGQAQSRKLPQAQFHLGDATQIDQVLADQDIEPGSFDIAYVRWVMCFVPDPSATIGAIVKMLRPGGKLLIQDYFNYSSMCLAPRSKVFEEVIQAIAKSWSEHGGDPDIMGRLPRIALDAGLELDHIARVEIGTARPGSTMWNWPASFWPVFIPRLEELGYITAGQHRAFIDIWKTYSEDPAAYMHLPPVYEMIATKPG
jgi:ubiquinone/menaquinone biosynthesis C-methylase UbiE